MPTASNLHAEQKASKPLAFEQRGALELQSDKRDQVVRYTSNVERLRVMRTRNRHLLFLEVRRGWYRTENGVKGEAYDEPRAA